MSLKKVIACIKRNKRFLITTHTNPEGDALGSELAFFYLLNKLGKRAIIINEDSLPYGYDFLPGINNIKKFSPALTEKNNLKDIRFDCFVIMDCSGLSRCGQVHKLNKGHKPVINIDHHISNEKFGEVNWVEPQASSCSEMVYKLYKKLRIPLCRDSALPLYAGIVTDTGSFRYTNTTRYTHQAAAELLKHDFDISRIYKSIYENIPFEDIRLLIKILPQLRRVFKGRVAWLQIKRNLLKNRRIFFDLSEALLSFSRAIKGVEAVVLFKENLGVKDEIRVNFRSQGKLDVNKIASFFGGGGHKTASGATVKGKIDTVRRKVLAKIKEGLK